MPEGRRAPGGWRAARGQQIFDAIRNTMQRTAIVAARQVIIGGPGFTQRSIRHRSDQCVEFRTKPLQPAQIKLRELDRAYLLGTQHVSKLADGFEGDVGVAHACSPSAAVKMKSGGGRSRFLRLRNALLIARLSLMSSAIFSVISGDRRACGNVAARYAASSRATFAGWRAAAGGGRAGGATGFFACGDETGSGWAASAIFVAPTVADSTAAATAAFVRKTRRLGIFPPRATRSTSRRCN